MTAEAKPTERRFHPRTQIRMPIHTIRLDPDGADLVEQVQMVDISRGGMGAVANRAFYPGQRLLVRLPAPGMAVRSITAIVRRCDKRDQQYRIGLEFDHPIASLYGDYRPAQHNAVAA